LHNHEDRYILGSSEKELERLDNIQSLVFQDKTFETLRLAGIKPGMKCLDLGCRTGNVTSLMKDLVGSDGKVVGLDANPDAISICIKKKHKDKTNTISPSPLSSIDNNIDFIIGDIYNTELEHSSFDFIYSRLLFQHLQHPSKAIKEMKRLASNNNNGIICTEDIDHGLWLSYPHDLHLEKLRKCLVRLLELSGSDPYIARKIYKIFLQNDLKPTGDSYSVCIPMSTCPHNMMGVSMAETLKDKILSNKLISYEDFDIMLHGLKEYSNNSQDGLVTIMGFRVWSNC
jgi:ubiquinone/menaquinone biosynthesis C-methylase UbiE